MVDRTMARRDAVPAGLTPRHMIDGTWVCPEVGVTPAHTTDTPGL
jgi:hypothetical protein